MYESLTVDVWPIRGEEKTAVNPVSFSDFIVMFIDSMLSTVDMDCSIVVMLVSIWYDVLNKLDVYNTVVVD